MGLHDNPALEIRYVGVLSRNFAAREREGSPFDIVNPFITLLQIYYKCFKWDIAALTF